MFLNDSPDGLSFLTELRLRGNARPEVVIELVETTTSGCAQIFLISLKSGEGFNHQNYCKQENYKVCNQLGIEDTLYAEACDVR